MAQGYEDCAFCRWDGDASGCGEGWFMEMVSGVLGAVRVLMGLRHGGDEH